MYQHSQQGIFIWLLVGLVLVALLIAVGVSMGQIKQAGIVHPSDQVILLRLLGVAFIMALVLSLFFRLTVEVDEHFVRAYFGIGIIGKRIPLSDIASIQPVTNPWWYGLGIHIIPGGWIWNISGTKAVELKLKSGRLFRLGTDEPEVLAEVIKGRIAA
jgi:hypothetical protein